MKGSKSSNSNTKLKGKGTCSKKRKVSQKQVQSSRASTSGTANSSQKRELKKALGRDGISHRLTVASTARSDGSSHNSNVLSDKAWSELIPPEILIRIFSTAVAGSDSKLSLILR